MVSIKQTDSENKDFRKLIDELERYLDNADKEAHAKCKQYNEIKSINHVIIAYIDEQAVGCGAIREYDYKTTEVKRMFVSDNARKKGIGLRILTELEKWAKELGFKRCILETGIMLPEAVRLYKKSNYTQIPNYGQYRDMEKSICFAKEL